MFSKIISKDRQNISRNSPDSVRCILTEIDASGIGEHYLPITPYFETNDIVILICLLQMYKYVTTKTAT